MIVSSSEQKIIDEALDQFDRLDPESQRVVEYALDRIVYGQSPELVRDDQRQPCAPHDQDFLINAIDDRLRRLRPKATL